MSSADGFIGRRDLVAGGAFAAGFAALGGTPATAQQGGVVHAPAVPCASAPGDIVGLLLQGTGSPAGTVTAFGHAFRQGDIPRDAMLVARLADGRPVPVQADVMNRHADGSARFAVVAVSAPALRRGEQAGVVLARAAQAPQPVLAIDPLLSGRSLVAELRPADGGAAWQVDLLARFREAVAAGGARVWQAGPLVVEARVALPVPAQVVGGATSARLVVDVSVRADGMIEADAWVRNDAAMRPGGGTAQYSFRVVADGRELLSAGPLTHFQYTAFGRRVGVARGGSALVPPLVRHDIGYLTETAAIANYDLSIGVAEQTLASGAAGLRSPEWNAPFSPRGMNKAMGSPGNRGEIGPTTFWQAAWLVSGDARARQVALDQAEATGSIPWAYWDPTAGNPSGTGAWIDVKRWPNLWDDARAGQPPNRLMQLPPMEGTGWRPIQSHQPDLCSVPYLLTGRRAFLDGVLAQGSWNVVSQYDGARAESTRTPEVRDLNVISGNQVRGAAWAMRQIENAAWLAPDNEPTQDYFRTVARANWAWMRAQLPAWTSLQGEPHGWIVGAAYGGAGNIAPWQLDFFTSTTVLAARRGNADARAALGWLANFVVGRFLAADRGFDPRDGIAYDIAVSPGGRGARPFQTWREVGVAMRERDLANGPSWNASNGYYGQLALQSLSQIVDVLGSDSARRAHAWLVASGAPWTSTADFTRDPTWAIVPRGTARVAARAPRCAAAAPPQR